MLVGTGLFKHKAAGGPVADYLYAWGESSWGQVDSCFCVPDKITRYPKSWVAISAASQIIFGIDTLGALYAWGSDYNGYLGLNTTNVNRSSPTQIGSSSWTAVSTNKACTLAIRADGALFGWGYNGSGTIGDGTTTSRSSPVQIGSSSWTAIAAGGQYGASAAIRSDGALFTWGGNSDGQLGNNSTVSSSSPAQVGSSSWTSVSVSYGRANRMLAIRTDGALFVWGGNNSGALGDGTTTNRSSPVQIGSSSWSVVCSEGGVNYPFTHAIRSDGALFAWGANTYGRLGDGTTTARSSPVQIGSSSWSAVKSGYNHAMAIRIDGAMFAWGSNTNKNIGTGASQHYSSPVAIGESTITFAAVNPGSGNFALDANAALYSWSNDAGYNMTTESQYLWLGHNGVRHLSPMAIDSGTQSWSMIAAGGHHNLALTSDNKLYAWGRNQYGQLGQNSSQVWYTSPVQVGSSSWTSISAGMFHSAAIRSDGGLFTWGYNNYGQLGSNSTTNISSPVQVGTSSWVTVSSVYTHSLAIRSDGGLFSWGRNTWGQLGSNSTANRSSPVQVGTSSWIAVANNKSHSMAIRSDGALFTWGGNSFHGALGDNTTTNKSSPVQIGTSSWTQISAGVTHSAAIRSDGGLFAWGFNTGGCLGINQSQYVNKSSPTQVGSSSWTMVSAGWTRTAGIRSDGALFTWGKNTYGALGDLTLTDRSSPVQVGSGSWVSVGAGTPYYLPLTNYPGHIAGIELV